MFRVVATEFFLLSHRARTSSHCNLTQLSTRNHCESTRENLNILRESDGEIEQEKVISSRVLTEYLLVINKLSFCPVWLPETPWLTLQFLPEKETKHLNRITTNTQQCLLKLWRPVSSKWMSCGICSFRNMKQILRRVSSGVPLYIALQRSLKLAGTDYLIPYSTYIPSVYCWNGTSSISINIYRIGEENINLPKLTWTFLVVYRRYVEQ